MFLILKKKLSRCDILINFLQDVSKFDSEAEDSKGRTYHRSMADRQAKIDRYKEAKELKIILEVRQLSNSLIW